MKNANKPFTHRSVVTNFDNDLTNVATKAKDAAMSVESPTEKKKVLFALLRRTRELESSFLEDIISVDQQQGEEEHNATLTSDDSNTEDVEILCEQETRDNRKEQASVERKQLSSDFLQDLYKLVDRNELDRQDWDAVERRLNDIPQGMILPNEYHEGVTYHRNILHCAAGNGVPPRVLQKLLAVVDLDFCLQPTKGDSPPIHAFAIANSITDSPDGLASLLVMARARPSELLVTNDWGESPLHLLLSGHFDYSRYFEGYEGNLAPSLQQLLDLCPKAIHLRSRAGYNLLHEAAHGAVSLDAMRVLLERKPSMLLEHSSGRHTVDPPGLETPLHLIVRYGSCDESFERLKLCVEYIDTDKLHSIRGTPDKKTLLHAACELLHVQCDGISRDVVELLVELDPHLVDAKDRNGNVPFDTFQNKFTESPSTAVPESLWTAVPFATRSPTIDAEVALTLLAGKRVQLTDSPQPSLHAILRNERLVLLLKAQFASALAGQLAVVDNNRDLPLHIVAATSTQDPTYIADHFGMLLQVIVNGNAAACSARNHEGLLPLALMIRSGHLWQHGTKVVFDAYPAAVGLLDSDDVTTLLRTLGTDDGDGSSVDGLRAINSVLHPRRQPRWRRSCHRLKRR